MITISHLSKSYRTGQFTPPVIALQNVSFEAAGGQIVGLLGVNGAGKSTLTRILLGLSVPDSGIITIQGRGPRDADNHPGIGYLPESFRVPHGMTAADLLQYVGTLRGLHGKSLRVEVAQALETFGLGGVTNQKVESFSKGMTQRLGIAQAFIRRPSLLVLDEPTEGLDPVARRMVREMLQHLSAAGSTIWLTSHALSEVELLAHQIVVLHKGCVVRHGSLQELLPRDRFTVDVQTGALIPGYTFTPHVNGWSCTVTGHDDLRSLIQLLQERDIRVASIRSARSNLEELFLSTIGKPATDADHHL